MQLGEGGELMALAPVRLTEAADSLAKASTPEPFSRSRTSNWIARTGGLPPYIQHIAHDLIEKRGKSESNAIQMAIGIVRNWARGGGNVDANTRAAASKAVAEFEAKRGAAKAAGGAKKLGKASEAARSPGGSLAVADKVALRRGALARLRTIAECYGAQVMAQLMEASAAPAAWSPELKRTASASAEIERREVHDGGQHVGYLSARKGYGPGSSRPTRYSAKAVNGKMVGETMDSKAQALDGLKKHLEEAPARVMAHRGGRFLVANPDSYSGPTTMTEFPSESSARYAAGLPEAPTSVETASKVAALGEMVTFDLLTLTALGEELSGELGQLAEAESKFSVGDRVNLQHSHFGRVPAKVTKVTSRRVHVSSPDPRVRDSSMTHLQAEKALSVTARAPGAKPLREEDSAGLAEGFRAFAPSLHPRGQHGHFSLSGGGARRPHAARLDTGNAHLVKAWDAQAQRVKPQAAKLILHKTQGMSTDAAAKALAPGGAIKDTLEHHAPAGRISPEREKLHRKIITHFLAEHAAQREPHAMFTAGGSASGKSRLLKLDHAPKDAVLVDPDEVRKHLPEYGQLVAGGRADIAASATHEEASHIAARITAAAIAGKRNIIIDGVGNSEPGKFKRKVEAAQKAGYRTEVHYAHMPLAQAEQLNRKRFEDTNRLVVPAVLRAKHKGVAERYSDIRAIKGVGVRVYDMSGAKDAAPKLVSEQSPGGRLKVHLPERQREFEAKARG